MGNTRSSYMCVIKEYRYHTISLSKYHGWCQYHKSVSIGSKRFFFKRSRKVKNGQYCKKLLIWSKPVPNWSKRSKRSKTVKAFKNGN